MSRENVDVVRRSMDAFRSGDVATSIAAFSAEVEWHTAADEPDPTTYRGTDGLVALIEDWSQMWEESFFAAVEPQEFIDHNDFVVVPVRAVVRGKGSGVEVEVLETYVFRLRNGQVVEVREFRTKAEALEAVGVSPGSRRRQ
jgi:ketosteroid isomerase-like protein